MSEQYPKSEGGMWKNSAKANEKHPDWRGHIEISSPQLRMLLDMAKENQANPDPEFKLKIQVAAWDRVAKQTGNQYFYLVLSLVLSLVLHFHEHFSYACFGCFCPQMLKNMNLLHI